jgi:hypothetical protein
MKPDQPLEGHYEFVTVAWVSLSAVLGCSEISFLTGSLILS